MPARASSSRRISSIHGPAAFDDGAAADLHGRARERVPHVRDRPALELDQLDAVEQDSTGVGRAAQVREAEPRIVGLRVRIEAGGSKAVEPQRRDELRRGGRRDHAAALGDGARRPAYDQSAPRIGIRPYGPPR